MAHSAAPSPLDVGSVIAGTYAIEGLIGKGGMGAVFLASHARLPGKKVAIKVLHADIADAESLERFKREAHIASRLGHPNIVEVHDFNVLPDGTPYLVLEYLVGESLGNRVARGPMSVDATVTIVRQIGSALAAAHREEIIHRDLKPHNVFLVQTETDGHVTERAKVLDFGISKIRGSQTIKTQDTAILGTPQYMAPEQALGHHAAVDARTDVFALGAIVYEMLSGRGTFAGASIPEVVFKVVYEEPTPLGQLVPGLPPHVVAAVHRALAKKADERFPDVASFIEALTGSPLVTARGPIPIPSAPLAAKPDSKNTGRDAFAQTIGSGDHAAAMGVGTAQTVASGNHPAPIVIPAAPSAQVPVAAPSATTHNLATGQTLIAQPPAPRGKGGLVIAGLAIVALAAVAIVFLVTRGGDQPAGKDDDPEPEPEPVAVVEPDAGPTPPGPVPIDAAAPAPPAIDAAPAADKPKPPPAKIDAGVKPAVAEDTSDDDDDDEGLVSGVAGLLAPCRSAIRDGDGREALTCAGKILETHPGNPQAYLIRGQAYCLEGDQEKAMGAMRKLSGKPRLRKQLVAFCRKNDVDLE